MQRLLATLFLILPLHAWSNSCIVDDAQLLSRPGDASAPTQVYLHSYINDIIAVRDAEQSFTADIFVRIEWDDPRLAHADNAPCSVDITAIWWPELQLLNRRSVQRVRDMVPSVQPDGRVSLLLRGFGEFTFNADLSDFPFDEQQLSIDILSIFSDSDIDFVYEEERFSLGEDLSVANFDIKLTGVEERSRHIRTTGRDHAAFSIQLQATRLTGFYTWQQLVPLFLVVLMAWVVFWIPRQHVPPRIGLAATSMLTLIAYRFAMSSVLPPIAYLTRLDIFIIGSSVLVFGALATAVAVTYLADLVDETLADRVNLAARVLTPLILVLIAAIAFLGLS